MRKVSVLLLLLLAATFASAATLTGTVKNLTTGKPSAGDTVSLLALSQGMSEIAHTKSDAGGNFTFDLDDPNTPHLVRVTHDGVNYFPPGGPIRPGMTTVEIPVYDGAKKIDGLSTTVDVMRVQADGGNLQILELVALKNDSKPPRALSADRSYEFYLPEGAQFDQMIAQAPGGMPVNVTPVPDGKGGKQYVNYALKPGETRFEIAYHLPYSGEATFTPKVTDKIQHFVIMMPKSMTFEAKEAARFSPMNEDKTANIQVATQVTPTTDLSFRISGTGMLPDETATAQSQQSAPSGGAMGGGIADNRPGGGLGAPIDAPDPLHNSRWLILGGLAIVMVAGGVFVVSRGNQQAAAAPATPVSAVAAPSRVSPVSVTAPVAPSVAKDRSSMLLEALKEELFQLEIEKQQGRISAEEYEKSKAALTQTLARALSRQSNA
jgi:hypothetical protein